MIKIDDDGNPYDWTWTCLHCEADATHSCWQCCTAVCIKHIVQAEDYTYCTTCADELNISTFLS